MFTLKPTQALDQIRHAMNRHSRMVHTQRWQAQDISENKQARMVEFLHYQFRMSLVGQTDIEEWQKAIPSANYPWAEDHFKERVCGVPLNPGTEWKNWPWSSKADESRLPNGQFNHNYMERFWPKYASDSIATHTKAEFDHTWEENTNDFPLNFGLRGHLGDYEDMVHQLATEPDTRQAYLPIWFPEDTGSINPGRKPCTLGYHFIMRNNRLDITYNIRSCDFYRHFDDDVYMAVRLAIHTLQSCKLINPDAWKDVMLGELVMNITSLHMFLGDYQLMFGQRHPDE